MHSHPSGQLRVILRRQTEVREVSRVGRITRYAAEIELSSQECRERTPSGRLTGSAVPEMGVDVSADETRLRFPYVKRPVVRGNAEPEILPLGRTAMNRV